MQVRHVATAAAIVLTLAGCQRTTSDGFSSSGSNLAPLEAQPVGGVQAGALPPPSSPTGVAPTQPGQFPTAPQMASATPAMSAPPATALDVRKEGMIGNWKVSNNGASCDMFLTLTNLGSGSRGGTRGCVGALTTMRSWEVSGKQVVLKDLSGSPIATLYKSGDTRYDGSLSSGGSISLSR